MTDLAALAALARHLGVLTHFTDGLGRHVQVEPETLVRVCRALGADLDDPSGAAAALDAARARDEARVVSPVVVAWDGILPAIPVKGGPPSEYRLVLEDGGEGRLEVLGSDLRSPEPVPLGYHALELRVGGEDARAAVISAPVQAWRRPESQPPDRLRSWGVGTHLAALRSRRSRAVGDLADLMSVCRWVGGHGGDLVTLLPVLPTFNEGADPEPSPYSPVSRLFWSELILDLGEHHVPVETIEKLDVSAADAEVRDALAHLPDPLHVPEDVARYARFRGAQKRMGRNWRDWPEAARNGKLTPDQVDPDEERFHRVAQVEVRRQLGGLLDTLSRTPVRLGLDLAVGVHPDGFDTWARQGLYASGMSVGAPPDPGFPSGQDWGFPPVLPNASRDEGHAYLAASIAHQAALCGVLRIDHVMAWTRLYWIPHGMGLHQGTYVSNPAEELFAILTLESHRNACEVVGENLGTVPPEIDEALPRHRIWGMYLAEFEAHADAPRPPDDREMGLIGTHDTPTLSGWIDGVDIDERVRCGLLAPEAAPDEKDARVRAAHRLAGVLGVPLEDRRALLAGLLDWMGRSSSPLVVPWIEDFWLENDQVNLPGTRSSERPNWQRPMGLLLEEVFQDPEVEALVRRLARAREDA